MSLLLFNAAPVPALAGLWECVQAPQVDLATFSPVVVDLWEQASRPEAFGMTPQEREGVQAALQTLSQEASRFSDDSGRVPSLNLYPSLQSLATAWPARLHARDDIGRDYVILGKMGGGGTSTIFHGHDPQDGTLVVIKVVEIPQDLPSHVAPEAVEQLLRHEYEILSGLRPGTGPRVFRLGTMNGKTCMVMEHLEGQRLFDTYGEERHGLKTGADLNRFLDIGRQAVAEVAALHQQGIVHCDVKSENFMYSAQPRSQKPRVRIFDFGGAVREGERHPFVLGTPEYMSPESWNDKNPVGFGRDVFALGVTLYDLLTGRLPFEGGSPQETARLAMSVDPEPPSVVLLRDRPDLRRTLPPALLARLRALDAIVMRALKRDVSLRYQDANHMLAELQNLAARPLTAFASLVVPRPVRRKTG